jgi:hypothetical protein
MTSRLVAYGRLLPLVIFASATAPGQNIETT